MIARGSFGQPWIFDQTRDLLDGSADAPEPSIEERFAVALDHARMANDYEPDRRGAAIEFRKHLGWYVKGLPGSAELRKQLHAVTSLGEVEGIFAEYLRTRDRYAIGRRDGRRAVGDDRGMRRERVRDLLQPGRGRSARVANALDALAFEPAESLGFATIDHHRALRQGFPEVIYGAGKTPEQICEIATRIAERGDGVLVTRIAADAVGPLVARLPGVEVNALGAYGYLPGRHAGRAGTGTVAS